MNILTNHAVNNRNITVFGGAQKRPNIHIEDVTDLYVKSLKWPDHIIDGNVFNAGYQNHSVMETAEIVKIGVGDDVAINTIPSDDYRSYHISSEKIKRELGFIPTRTIQDAVDDLVVAFNRGFIPNSMDDSNFYNIKTMQNLELR